MILGMVRTFVDHIISQQNITSPDQLKGKIGGVNRIGSTSDMGLRFALRRLDIDPDKDTKIITAGGNPERFAALTKGVINFTIMPEPFVRQALQLGFRDLVRYRFAEDSVLVERRAVARSDRQSQAAAASEIRPRHDRGDSLQQDPQRRVQSDLGQIFDGSRIRKVSSAPGKPTPQPIPKICCRRPTA